MDTNSIFNCNWSVKGLSAIRAQAVQDEAAAGREITTFTCDQCESRFKCVFVFDGYNTDGDCLADK